MDAEDADITSEDSRSSDEESMGSLKEFIVKDEESSEDESETSSSGEETELTEEDTEESSEDSEEESEDDAESATSKGSKASAQSETKSETKIKEPKTKKIRLSKEKEDEIAELKAEAERFIAGVSGGTTIGQRTLRSRAPEAIESRKPKDTYYEKYAKQEEAKLMEKFKKKDIIDFLKKLEPEWRKQYEDAGHVWPSPKITMSLEAIEDLYKPIKEFAKLPDSDEEDSDEASILSDDEEESDLESEESI